MCPMRSFERFEIIGESKRGEEKFHRYRDGMYIKIFDAFPMYLEFPCRFDFLFLILRF